MSLTSHIKAGKKSPIGQFLLQHFSLTRNITTEANKQLQNASNILPTDQPLPRWVYGTLGEAIDYRIRYSFRITPSHELLAWEGAWGLMNLSDRWKLSNKVNETFFEKGSLSQGARMPNYYETEREEDTSLAFYTFEVINRFFEGLDAVLAAIQPVRRCLSVEEERVLARYCFVLSLFEEAYRSGAGYRDWNSILLTPNPRQSVDELLALPKDAWVEDLCAMSLLFCERCHHHFTRSHLLNPTFSGSNDVGEADADLIVDGSLVELKASISPKLDPNWLRQLVGYLLLDYDDRYHITYVSIYVVRQGMSFTWTVKQFLRKLTGDEHVSLSTLRQEFQTLIGT